MRSVARVSGVAMVLELGYAVAWMEHAPLPLRSRNVMKRCKYDALLGVYEVDVKEDYVEVLQEEVVVEYAWQGLTARLRSNGKISLEPKLRRLVLITMAREDTTHIRLAIHILMGLLSDAPPRIDGRLPSSRTRPDVAKFGK